MGLPVKAGGSEHKFVQTVLHECSVPEGQELGQLLKNLHQSRREADYDMHIPQYERQVASQLCVARAKEIQLKLQACSAGTVNTKIKLGIKAYLRKTNQL